MFHGSDCFLTKSSKSPASIKADCEYPLDCKAIKSIEPDNVKKDNFLKEYEKISCKIVLNFVKTESKFMLY